MQLLRMKREEKLDLILLARYLERRSGKRHGNYYARNFGTPYNAISHKRFSYLLHPSRKWLRDGVVFYSQGWGWRVRKDWREVVKQIETRKYYFIIEKQSGQVLDRSRTIKDDDLGRLEYLEVTQTEYESLED